MSELILSVDEKPKKKSVWLLLSFQHIFAAFSGIVAVPIVFAGALGFNSLETAEIISDMLIVSGVITIIQCYGVGIFGSRLPQIMGSNFAFIGPGLAIGAMAGAASGGSPQAAYGAILGASMLGSVVQIILGSFIEQVKTFFPPIVQGCVVTLIGMTILGVAIDWLGGGYGSADYGSPSNLILGISVMVLIILLNQYGKGIVSSGAIFWGTAFGYILASSMGKLDLTPVTQAGYLYFPRPFKYGITFNLSYALPFAIAYLVALVESAGDTLACAKVANINMEEDKTRLKGSILLGGVGSLVGAIFNATPTTTFSQNTGIVSLTGVASRFVVIGSGVILILMGLFPKFSALVAVMPAPVLGGAGVVMFGMISAVGIGIFHEIEFDKSNMLIIGISLSCGLGVTLRPNLLEKLPTIYSTILSSGITTGTIVAVGMTLIFRKIKRKSK